MALRLVVRDGDDSRWVETDDLVAGAALKVRSVHDGAFIAAVRDKMQSLLGRAIYAPHLLPDGNVALEAFSSPCADHLLLDWRGLPDCWGTFNRDDARKLLTVEDGQGNFLGIALWAALQVGCPVGRGREWGGACSQACLYSGRLDIALRLEALLGEARFNLRNLVGDC